MINMENKIIIVSNIIFEPYLQIYISKTFSACASNVQLIYISDKEIRDNHEVLKNVDIIIIALNFDLLYPNILNDVMLNKVLTGDITKATIMMCRELYYSIKDCSKAKVIWFGLLIKLSLIC